MAKRHVSQISKHLDRRGVRKRITRGIASLANALPIGTVKGPVSGCSTAKPVEPIGPTGPDSDELVLQSDDRHGDATCAGGSGHQAQAPVFEGLVTFNGVTIVAQEFSTVFATAESKEQIGSMQVGDKAVTNGPMVIADGYEMVPIKPIGAVQWLYRNNFKYESARELLEASPGTVVAWDRVRASYEKGNQVMTCFLSTFGLPPDEPLLDLARLYIQNEHIVCFPGCNDASSVGMRVEAESEAEPEPEAS